MPAADRRTDRRPSPASDEGRSLSRCLSAVRQAPANALRSPGREAPLHADYTHTPKAIALGPAQMDRGAARSVRTPAGKCSDAPSTPVRTGETRLCLPSGVRQVRPEVARPPQEAVRS